MDNLIKNTILIPFNMLYKISPRLTLKLLFRLKQGYRLNLENPKTYNEKLQWIKLYDKNPLMTKCCDKYAVRKYVKQQGCKDILNHLIWQGFDPEEIPFSDLPKKYVIKVTHGSTFNIIQNGKLQITQKEIISRCRKWLKAKFLSCYGEWFYGVERPRVIVEDFIESADDTQLRDYKIFCFNGYPKIIRVDTDRFADHRADCFDCEWNHIDRVGMGFETSGRIIEKPVCLEEMLEYAAKLSAPFRHARVDLYIVREKIYFGEITFTNGAGFDKFSSYDFDLMLGDLLKL